MSCPIDFKTGFMIPEVPERSNYVSSSLYLIFGLLFLIYPFFGVLKDDFIVLFRPSGRAYHLHGVDAIIIGVGVSCLGFSMLVASVKNILTWRRIDFYTRPSYPRLQKLSSSFRNVGLLIVFIWSLVSCTYNLVT